MDKQDIYQWDHHSDQPHVIRNKAAKRKLYFAGASGSLKTFIVALFALPIAWFLRINQAQSKLPCKVSDIGLGVSIESDLPEKTVLSTQQLAECIEGLGVQALLLRVPLADIKSLEDYKTLADSLDGKRILIDILQDRRHIEDSVLLEQNLRKIFNAFSSHNAIFKLGNAINRRKWAFISIDEYFNFFAVAQSLRDHEFPEIKLLGGGIIDFELPNFARSLFHFAPVKYDGIAALLYVDRRGAPENTQLGANLLGKISWFKALMRLSRKTIDKLYITETNWPLTGTEPFAPAVGDCMVDEDRQAAYLARYYLLAFASGQAEAVYWHQLVAPGYGLIDNRGEQIRKRRAYYALKTLNKLFLEATVTSFEQHDQLYMLIAEKNNRRITAIWTNDTEQQLQIDSLQILSASSSPESIEIFQLTGERVEPSNSTITISGEVTYFLQQMANGSA